MSSSNANGLEPGPLTSKQLRHHEGQASQCESGPDPLAGPAQDNAESPHQDGFESDVGVGEEPERSVGGAKLALGLSLE